MVEDFLPPPKRKNDEFEFFEDESDSYPWKGAIIAIGITIIVVFVFILPWVYGVFKILGG